MVFLAWYITHPAEGIRSLRRANIVTACAQGTGRCIAKVQTGGSGKYAWRRRSVRKIGPGTAACAHRKEELLHMAVLVLGFMRLSAIRRQRLIARLSISG